MVVFSLGILRIRVGMSSMFRRIKSLPDGTNMFQNNLNLMSKMVCLLLMATALIGKLSLLTAISSPNQLANIALDLTS